MEIKLAQNADFDQIWNIYVACRNDMLAQNIMQWNENYPTHDLIQSSIDTRSVYALFDGTQIIGAITVDEEQDGQYVNIGWTHKEDVPMVIHRLVVLPEHQKNGYAQQLMDFAETHAKESGYPSIRLDAYSQNQRIQDFYKRRGYQTRGEVFFQGKPDPFICFELDLIGR